MLSPPARRFESAPQRSRFDPCVYYLFLAMVVKLGFLALATAS